jgi:phosphatidylglycerophosphate synthase
LLCGAASDFFDGYFARKLKVESKFGELLDPLADKIFSNVVLWGIYFYFKAPFPILLVAVFLTVRDCALLIGGGAVLTKKLTVDIKPIYASKICTALIFTLCILSVIFNPNLLLLKILSVICLLLIIFTFFKYIGNFLRTSRHP